jgi:N-formylglutamate deformylase
MHPTPTHTLHRGSLPLLISIPHAGTEVPVEIQRRLTLGAQALPDTDWHVDSLYRFARELGASVLVAHYSRYVVDLNRAPDSAPLYENGVPTSPVCPIRTFADEPIYLHEEPDASEIAERIDRYWRPYHNCLAQELERLRDAYGYALLWDGHSVASEVHGLFTGVLPEFNLGTRDDASCPRFIAESLLDMITSDGKYGAVLNGRFKGGYITAHYGQPAQKVFAMQLELAQRVYMNESSPTQWEESTANAASEMIGRLLKRYLELGRAEMEV